VVVTCYYQGTFKESLVEVTQFTKTPQEKVLSGAAVSVEKVESTAETNRFGLAVHTVLRTNNANPFFYRPSAFVAACQTPGIGRVSGNT